MDVVLSLLGWFVAEWKQCFAFLVEIVAGTIIAAFEVTKKPTTAMAKRGFICFKPGMLLQT